MLTDRELLEAAAKAAGVSTYCDTVDARPLCCKERGLSTTYATWWNPLTDDGDALRLAVKLGMRIYAEHNIAKATALFAGRMSIRIENFDGDPCAATRRAIVRAAAAMVKA